MNALPPGTVRTLAPPTPYLRYAALAFLCACSSGATPAGDSPVSDGGHAGSVDAGNLDARSSDTHDPVGAVADASAVDGPSGGDSGPSADAGATPPVDAGASRLAGGACPDLGWCDLPNTKLQPVCPDPGTFNLSGSCEAVISAWAGGTADLPRSRLLFWGGGHGDYNGNEIYALSLQDLTLTRLDDPSPPNDCAQTLSDGRPASRHTYGGISFLADVGLVYMYGGATACTDANGTTDWISPATWTLDPATLAWTRKDPTQGGPALAPDCCDYISASDYDPNSHAVYMLEESTIWRYDEATNTYSELTTGDGIDYHESAVVDSERSLFLIFGGGQVWAVDLSAGSHPTPQDWSTSVTGCDTLAAAAYPGLTYDSSQGLVVGWAGGGTVYTFDATAKACNPHAFSGGPGDAQGNGTQGRFRYFPSLNVFALVNDWQEDAYVLRLTP